MASFELVEPLSLSEAFQQLDGGDPAIRPIGGGTALMLMMKSQLFRPIRLVSLRKLTPGLSHVSWSDDGAEMRVGAMTTFAELEHSDEIYRRLPVIRQTMKTLANVRVRNVASVGGNLAHGDPHLDLPPVWIALGAHAVIAGPGGQRIVPVEDLYLGYYETIISQNEIITELRVPVRPGWCATYVKVTTRAAHDWPALSLAISAKLTSRHVDELRLVLSAAVDKPVRLTSAEGVLRGSDIDDAVLKQAGDAAIAEIDMESDSRGSADYKRHLLGVHLARAMRALPEGQAA